jgi:Tfp pilus assembly protein PilZ
VQTASDRRYRKRLPCRLAVPSGSYGGMVLNLSRGGLFVQTSAAASPGEAVHLDLDLEGGGRIGLDARVVWRRVVAPHLRAVSTGGIGMHIQYASGAWFGLVARLAEGAPAAAGEAPALPQPSAGPSFRVRLRLAGASRTRVLVVSARDEAEARARVRQQAGPQWLVLGLDRIERDA